MSTFPHNSIYINGKYTFLLPPFFCSFISSLAEVRMEMADSSEPTADKLVQAVLSSVGWQ